MRALTSIVLLGLVSPVLAGMKLTSFSVDGVENNEGLRGYPVGGDLFQANGGNRFWCGLLFNTFKAIEVDQGLDVDDSIVEEFDRLVGGANVSNGTIQEIKEEIKNVTSDPKAKEDLEKNYAHKRAVISPGSTITIEGTTTEALMGNEGGRLSFAYNPGNPNFMAMKSKLNPDGGFELGEPPNFYEEIEAWPVPGETGMRWQYKMEWPNDVFNGTYTIQVLFRSYANDNKNETLETETFAQCIDLLVIGGQQIPDECDVDDLNSCEGILPVAQTAVPLPPPVVATAPPVVDESMPTWMIVVIVVCALIMLLICLALLYFCVIKQEKKEPEVPNEDEAILHKDPEPPSKEPSSENSDSNIVQIQYTDPMPLDQEAPLPDSEGTGDSEPMGDGSQGRVFHFRYIANDPTPAVPGSEGITDDTSEQGGYPDDKFSEQGTL